MSRPVRAAGLSGKRPEMHHSCYSIRDPSVVDWECAEIGDPAYDLAIVTRGSRRVCGVPQGSDILLESYASAGGVPITRRDILCHELVLFLRWHWLAWEAELRGDRQGQGPDFYESRLESLLSRAQSM